MSLVSRMVELHGGSVSVESEVGQGSRFTVSLPWREPSQYRKEIGDVESAEQRSYSEQSTEFSAISTHRSDSIGNA